MIELYGKYFAKSLDDLAYLGKKKRKGKLYVSFLI